MPKPTNFPLPAELSEIVINALPTSQIVGGAVRDWLLGMKPKDLDVEVYGMAYEQLHNVLNSFGKVDLVGKSFGVIKLRLPSGNVYDFSLARKDSKRPNETGHKAFDVTTPVDLSQREAALRRDFTINALAFDPRKNEIVDHFGGLADIESRTLRHTSTAFAEDPLRVLRLFQFAGRFELQPHPETVALCRQLRPHFSSLAVERVGGEWFKWAAKSKRPSLGLKALVDTGWIECFPALAAIQGVEQDPQWHPEGDVLTHTMHCCDAMAKNPEWRALPEEERAIAMYGILCHDFGKPSCTKRVYKEAAGRECITSPGHDAAGVEPTVAFLKQLNAPNRVTSRVTKLVRFHMEHIFIEKDGDIRRLAHNVYPETIAGVVRVMDSDHGGRPPLAPGRPDAVQRIVDFAKGENIYDRPPTPLLTGKMLLDWGLTPGPRFGAIQDAAFEAQLDGKLRSIDQLEPWYRSNRAKVFERAGMSPRRILSGEALLAIGLTPGERFRKIHTAVFEAQLDETITDADSLRAFLQKSTDLVPKDIERLVEFSHNQELAAAHSKIETARKRVASNGATR